MESIQNTKKDGYKSPNHKLIKFFKNSRDKWKARATDRRKNIRDLQIKIRDLNASREKWKKIAKDRDKEIDKLKGENNSLSKDLKQFKENVKETENSSVISVPQIDPEEEKNKNVNLPAPYNHKCPTTIIKLAPENSSVIPTPQVDLEEEKNKNVNLPAPYNYKYPTTIIKLALDLFSEGLLGFRAIARVFKILANFIGNFSPHFTTIRQWVLKMGLFQVSRDIEKRDDWIWLLDFSAGVGAQKCLVILGVRFNNLLEEVNTGKRVDLTLSHKDVCILGIYPTKQADGEFVCEKLEEVTEKTQAPLAVVTDEGSDIKKGASMYVSKFKKTILIFDIAHKIALIIKGYLEDNERWNLFVGKVAKTKQLIQQTQDFAALSPPNQRSKSRFMNADIPLNWVRKIEEVEHLWNVNEKAKERFQQYFGWIKDFKCDYDKWNQIIEVAEQAKYTMRSQGLSEQSYTNLENIFMAKALSIGEVTEITGKILDAIKEEVDKLPERRIYICSTEVLESVFGKYKEINNAAAQGITAAVLSIATFLSGRSESEVKTGMEESQIHKVAEWIQSNANDSLARIRRAILEAIKGNTKGMTFSDGKKVIPMS